MIARILSSPRRRRRLGWVLGLCAGAAVVAIVISLIPSHGAATKVTSRRAPSSPTFTAATAPRVATTRAETVARAIAVQFTGHLARRRDLTAAYGRLSARLRSRYSLDAWRAGDDFPVLLDEHDTYAGSSIAYSSPGDVGLVLEFDRFLSSGDAKLVAIRLQKHGGRWSVVYIRQGHSSSRIDDTNFAPAGFYPGSTPTGVTSWLPLAGVLLLLIGLGVVLERRGARRSIKI